jgi:hypothetical protein
MKYSIPTVELFDYLYNNSRRRRGTADLDQCGKFLPCINIETNDSALKDACMMAAARVDPVACRIHPNVAPASPICTAERHESPYSQ